MNYKIILTGATGMVGEGVLLACLADTRVATVLSISRKPCGRTHPKLQEYIVPDFMMLKGTDETLAGYDACFFCAGISSIGMKEAEYARITYDTTLHVAKALLQQNGNFTFIYVSGVGTDGSERGRQMWARVKGKTENALMRLPFKNVYNFRPAFMKLMPGQKNALPYYKYVAWMFPFLKRVVPNYVSTLQQVGRAMITILEKSSKKQVLEVADINALGN